jgi:hypothetical protein
MFRICIRVPEPRPVKGGAVGDPEHEVVMVFRTNPCR